MNSTQQRLAVVDRMYSGYLSHTYLGSLSLLNPEVPSSFLQVKVHTFASACLGMASVMRGFPAMHASSLCLHACHSVVGCDVHTWALLLVQTTAVVSQHPCLLTPSHLLSCTA